jgi:hypothetical protein
MSESGRPIIPLPPRGGYLLRGDERRPHVETRGPFIRNWPFDEAVGLRFLLDKMRDDRELPLTMMVSAGKWLKDSESARFVDVLSSAMDRRLDAIWIAAPRPIDWTVLPGGSLPNAVLLNLENAVDMRLTKNLVLDLLFLPAEDKSEEVLLEQFIRRTALVIVPRDAPRAVEIAALAEEHEMTTLCWDAVQGTVEKRSYVALTVTPDLTTTDADLNTVGAHLATLAKQLTPATQPRSAFRSALAGLIPTFGTRPRWDEDLLRLADRFKWPKWAVQTLPFLYVRTATDEQQRATALVWRPLLEWIDNRETYLTGSGKMCGGEIWEVLLPQELDQVLSEIHAQIQENLKGNPFHGSGAFFARIADAIDAVANARGSDSVSKRLRELSRALPQYARER